MPLEHWGTMSRRAATSEPKDATPITHAATHQSTHSPLGKGSDESASLLSTSGPILPKGTVLTPIRSVPDKSTALTPNRENVPGTLPPKSSAQVVPVKLWRNPYAASSDLATAPVVHQLDKPKPLPESPFGQKEAISKRLPPQPANNDEAVKNADTVLVVKMIQNGKTVITAQHSNLTAKELSCSIVSKQHSPSNANKLSNTTTGSTVKLVQIAATTTTSNLARVSDSAPKLIVAASTQAKTAPSRTSVTSSVLSKTENQQNIQTASSTARPLNSILGKRPPAVIHIAPAGGVPASKRILVLPGRKTTVPTKVNSNHASLSAQSKPRGVTRSSNDPEEGATPSKSPDAPMSSSNKQDRVGEMTHKVSETITNAEHDFEQQKEDFCGIKISSVISLAGQENLTFPARVAPPESERGVSTDSSYAQSSGSSSADSKEDEEETDSDIEAPHLNKADMDVIELCSFQAKKGNSVIGSQIVFKPAPVAGNARQALSPSSKMDRLREVIRLLEEDTLQDCDMFTDREKELLMSLLHRVRGRVPQKSKKNPKPCSSGTSAVSTTPSQGTSLKSKVTIKTEPADTADTLATEPGREKSGQGTSCLDSADASKSQGSSITTDPEVRIKREPGVSTDTPALQVYQRDLEQGCSGSGAVAAYKSPHNPSIACTKTKPKSPLHSVPSAKKDDTVSRESSTSHKPLRRIVITSDEVPVISSDEVKNGLEAFLIRNNISNNFSKDEVIKLHWDGKDVKTFHFRDIDSEEVQPPPIVAPKVVRPAILRSGKAPAPASDVGAEPLVTSAAQTRKQGVCEPVTAKAENVVEESTVPMDGTDVRAGFKAVRVKCRTESGQLVDCLALKSLKPIRVIGSTAGPEKPIGFLPRVIRYINESGQVVEKLVNPQQQIVPVVPSLPGSSKTTTASLPSKSVLKSSYSKPAGLTKPSAGATSAVPAQVAKVLVPDVISSSTMANLLAKQPEVIASPSTPTVCPPGGSRPVAPPNVVIVKVPVALGLQSAKSLLPARVAVSKPTPPTASKPESSAKNDKEKMFEPECLLEVSSNRLDVQSWNKKRLDDNSSSDSSSTSSSDASDYVPPVVKRKENPKPTAPKRSPQKRSTVMREYRTRKRRLRRRPQTVETPSSSNKCKASKKKNGVNMAMRSSNCIDRPCVVSMYHLNDSLFFNGSVNLASVKSEDLFVLASSPVVRLSPGKVVSVVELKPQTSDLPKQAVEVSGVADTDNVEHLLREQQNELVQLRRKYKKQSS